MSKAIDLVSKALRIGEGRKLRSYEKRVAQIDPLVAYKNEGFAMFEELMRAIWEEFGRLLFHAEVTAH